MVNLLQEPPLDQNCMVWNASFANWTPFGKIGGREAFFANLQRGGNGIDEYKVEKELGESLISSEGVVVNPSALNQLVSNNYKLERERSERERVFDLNNARAFTEISAGNAHSFSSCRYVC